MAEQIEMPRVKLGSQGLEVSRLGYGCMGLSGAYGDTVPEENGIAIIKEAFSKGITFFDTSDAYGPNHANECLVGKAIKQLPREKVQLAAKFGVAGYDASGVIVKGSPEYARSCCEASLKALDVDYIDLYYIHRIDATVPIEYTIGELKKLVNEGKIKYIGLSEASPNTIRRAHAVHPITAIQMDYSLWIRDIEGEIIPLCRELGIGIVPYSPLGRGFFAGKATVESAEPNSSLTSHPRLQGENFDKNKVLYFRIQALAEKRGCTAAQLAIAWVLHQGDDIVPIPDLLSSDNYPGSGVGTGRAAVRRGLGVLGDAVAAAGDWRTQLPADSRQRMVAKIMKTLMRHLPFAGEDGMNKLWKIVVRFEEKTYSAATNQSDYLRKISLKMMTMGTRSQNLTANSIQFNAVGNTSQSTHHYNIFSRL